MDIHMSICIWYSVATTAKHKVKNLLQANVSFTFTPSLQMLLLVIDLVSTQYRKRYYYTLKAFFKIQYWLGTESLKWSPCLPLITISKHTKAVLGSVKTIYSKFVKCIIGGLGYKCPTHVIDFYSVEHERWPEQSGLKSNWNQYCMSFLGSGTK